MKTYSYHCEPPPVFPRDEPGPGPLTDEDRREVVSHKWNVVILNEEDAFELGEFVCPEAHCGNRAVLKAST